MSLTNILVISTETASDGKKTVEENRDRAASASNSPDNAAGPVAKDKADDDASDLERVKLRTGQDLDDQDRMNLESAVTDSTEKDGRR